VELWCGLLARLGLFDALLAHFQRYMTRVHNLWPGFACSLVQRSFPIAWVTCISLGSLPRTESFLVKPKVLQQLFPPLHSMAMLILPFFCPLQHCKCSLQRGWRLCDHKLLQINSPRIKNHKRKTIFAPFAQVPRVGVFGRILLGVPMPCRARLAFFFGKSKTNSEHANDM